MTPRLAPLPEPEGQGAPGTPGAPSTPDMPGTPGTSNTPSGVGGPSSELPKMGNLPPVSSATPMAEGPKGESLGYVKPLRVDSLASQQGQEGLREVLAGAEKLVSEGRYGSAVDRYELAQRSAPNDPTIMVGRAHAELGSGVFARAFGTLNEAVRIEPAILQAQYDLRKSIGEKRLQVLVNDLKRLSVENEKAGMPVAMLAYIAYNTGDEERAVALLKEASARVPGDELVKAMQARWKAGAK